MISLLIDELKLIVDIKSTIKSYVIGIIANRFQINFNNIMPSPIRDRKIINIKRYLQHCFSFHGCDICYKGSAYLSIKYMLGSSIKSTADVCLTCCNQMLEN